MDFPLTSNESDSLAATNKLLQFLSQNENTLIAMGFTDINYRLGNDNDRQKSNYMIRNENGHIANKKSRINLLPPESEVE
jgi:hypothetical protein